MRRGGGLHNADLHGMCDKLSASSAVGSWQSSSADWGDTSPTDAIVENCNGCDILISEAYARASFDLVSPEWQRYRLAFHTSAQELGAIASKAKPGLLILYHRGNAGCDQAGTEQCREAGSENQLLKEVRQAYSGKVVAGQDLDVY